MKMHLHPIVYNCINYTIKFYLLRGVCRPASDIGVVYPPSPRCLALAHSSAIRRQSLGSDDTGGLEEDGLGLL